MKLAVQIILGLGLGFVLALYLLGRDAVKSDPSYAKEAQANAMCDEAMSDAAPGSEKRMTRRVCDELKARIKSERP